MENTARVNYLDWLRIFAIIGVLLFHSAMPFSKDYQWHISNPEGSDILTEFIFWLSRFRMPLLFFISGAVTWFMVKRRTTSGFILLRLRRLFIPLIVGILVVVPPQVYLERLSQGYKGSYWTFLLSVFSFKPYPEGNFSWHHLWFIVYLFIYDMLLAPFFKWCAGEQAVDFRQKLHFFATKKNVYLLIIPTSLLYGIMVSSYPQTNALINDPLFFIYWMGFVLVGFICMVQPTIIQSLERNRHLSLGIAFLLLVIVNCIRWGSFEWSGHSSPARESWHTKLFSTSFPLMAWTWVFAIVGYGKRYLNITNRAMDYLNTSIYPFFILHQTVIILITYRVVQSTDGIGLKYVFIVISTLFATIMTYHLFIRPFPIMRFLFGMKPLKKKSPIPHKKKAVMKGAEVSAF
ncbi:acyltransferase family protein [Olivibacter sp. SDN3]|uniref:acyltransferase family protein n=1 Tax=Olivibacter sp. SDN3 TaxID=2764720 RepID=UPI0016511338|nr:acyltransferase family protein [Olivibacter sp. SDN3]QNL49035.1 acyltransferase family protein [Olivibacter sp. SDN3]